MEAEEWAQNLKELDERYDRLTKVEGEIHDREDRMLYTVLFQVLALIIQITVLIVTLAMR